MSKKNANTGAAVHPAMLGNMRGVPFIVPIFLEFNLHSMPIGHVQLDQKFKAFFPELTLAPGYIALENKAALSNQITHFGLIPTKRFIDYLNQNDSLQERKSDAPL